MTVTLESPKHVAAVYNYYINPLTPNDPYRGCTATLTSKVAFYVLFNKYRY
jgi:hypothetical protein